jgi:uncharacterized protein (TIGR03437 family)
MEPMLRALAALLFFGPTLHGADDPGLSAERIVNAADYHAGAVAPSEVVVLYPTNAGPSQMISWHIDTLHIAQHPTDPIGETRVLFDGEPAPIVYTMGGQICSIVPYHVSGKAATEVVVEYQGRRSPPVTLPVVASAPALFTLDASGRGQAAMLNDTGCCNSVRNPVARGKVAVLYATGEGLALPANGKFSESPVPVKVTIGGVLAEVLWAANVGIFQINVRVPAKAPVGDSVPVALSVGNVQSSALVTMAVRSARQQILVVESDPAVRRRLAAILTSPDYDIVTAPDIAHALNAAKDRHFDLVIADLAVPAQASLGMLRVLQQERRQVKIAAIAATMSPGTLKSADLLGAQAILTKPLAAQTVRQRVRKLLQRRQAVY